jgi:DNA-binding NtrC family response regulator/CHASE2 domain-containing sensor protein
MKNIRSFLPGLSTTGIILLLLLFLPSLFYDLDHWMLTTWYRLRGEHPADTSIIIIYFGNNDLTTLGGMPLKRSYYALLVQALHELETKVVGIDIAFSEPDAEHPEYDKTLVTTIQQAGNVILSSYFRVLSESQSEEEVPKELLYNNNTMKTIYSGKDLQMPFHELCRAAAGCGHTNLMGRFEVPLLLNVNGGAMPAFFVEVLRVATGKNKNEMTIPSDSKGLVRPNFLGNTRSFETISALSFLHLYDSLQRHPDTHVLRHHFRGKIVLVGIIAEGRSTMFESPFDNNLPPIVLHATLLDNALRGNFLVQMPPIFLSTLALIVGIVISLIMTSRNEIGSIALSMFLLIVVWIGGYVAFVSFAWFIPISSSLFTGGMVLIVQLIFRHRMVRNEVKRLIQERNSIVSRLREKEQRLQYFEQKVHEQSFGSEQAAVRAQIEQYQREIQQLKSRSEDLQPYDLSNENEAKTEIFHGIVYSPKGQMAEVVATIKKIANHDGSVLIVGESGTGKELVAKALHECSTRKNKPFIAVNCGALSETLLESELFGHEKGAFSGAIKEKPGRFELANEGTIFLDEIAETSESFQIKLLRVLQEGTFERVGGTVTKKVNVRILAATNRSVKKALEEKKLREDLYYRLNVFTLELPPLRERTEDICLLANYFLSQEAETMSISMAVMNIFQHYQWRGNIRELQSAMKRAVVLAKADGRTIIRVRDLPEEIVESSSYNIDIEQQILEILREKKFSRRAISETAEQLGGMNRGTVAEYFRGYCFMKFFETGWNIERTVEIIAGEDAQDEMKTKVRKKILEYLYNAVELVETQKSVQENLSRSKPKYKNLPQKYHEYLTALITAYCEGKWTLSDKSIA